MMHCLSAGIAIPEQVALAGFNGLPFLEALPIRLTTIETPHQKMGQRAALFVTDAPLKQDSLPRPERVDLGFRLVHGESC